MLVPEEFAVTLDPHNKYLGTRDSQHCLLLEWQRKQSSCKELL